MTPSEALSLIAPDARFVYLPQHGWVVVGKGWMTIICSSAVEAGEVAVLGLEKLWDLDCPRAGRDELIY